MEKEIKAGDTVNAYGFEWEVLDKNFNGGILCLMKNGGIGVVPACIFAFLPEEEEPEPEGASIPKLVDSVKQLVRDNKAIWGEVEKHRGQAEWIGELKLREGLRQMENLKPCPFCGSHATLYHRGTRRPAWRASPNIWTPRCGNRKCIGYTIRLYFDTEQKAIDAWNRRAIDALMEDDGE